MKKATIFNRIISHETTSVEIISVLGRELYGPMYSINLASLILQKHSASILLTMKHGLNTTAVLALKFWKAKQNTEKLSIQLRKN